MTSFASRDATSPSSKATTLLSIGTFARSSGLTASALRFYDDAGILTPDSADPSSGYRRYHPAQLPRAVLLRRLREISLPLTAAQVALDGDRETAAQIVADHLAVQRHEAAEMQHLAARLVDELRGRQGSQQPRVMQDGGYAGRGMSGTGLRGPVVAAALAQALTAVSADPSVAPLTGVHIQYSPASAPELGDLVFTATDRYRLVRRTLPLPAQGSSSPPEGQATHPGWEVTVDGDDLRRLLPAIRSQPRVGLAVTAADNAGGGFLVVAPDTAPLGQCALLDGPFPDCTAMLAGLAAVTDQLTLPRRELLTTLHTSTQDTIALGVGSAAPGTWFSVTTLYPAVDGAVGADVLIDLRGPDQPATVRSADDGDLLSLVMPVAGSTA